MANFHFPLEWASRFNNATAWNHDDTDPDYNPFQITGLDATPNTQVLIGASRPRKRRIVSDHSRDDRQFLARHFPHMLPSVPDISERRLPLMILNPYEDSGNIQHAKLGRSLESARGLMVNQSDDLLKFKRAVSASASASDERHHYGSLQEYSHTQGRFGAGSSTGFKRSLRGRRRGFPPIATRSMDQVSRMPPGFALGIEFAGHDKFLFRFYVFAFCSGRTLLEGSNSLLKDITPMVSRSPCVKHALLAVAATYVLDYKPDPLLENIANEHHKEAIKLLGEDLSNPDNYALGKEEPIIAAMILLNQDDVINWEFRDKQKTPKWYLALEAARTLLNVTDPGYRYKNPNSVQSSNARRQLSGMMAEESIFCAVVNRLDSNVSKRQFPWLLEGDFDDITRIGGLIGMSPKLLHLIFQVTHLCARFLENPDSEIYPIAAEAIEKQLNNIWQWSEAQMGFASADELFQACILDENGWVDDAGMVTLLGAEAHAMSARIYLQCRFFRKPRNHPDVERAVRGLIHCIRISPNSGPLFTSQAPFFSVTLAGLVSYLPEHRDVVRRWFEPVVSGSRGNVPPAWEAVKHLWEWHDTNSPITDIEISPVLQERHPWWEDMVEELLRFGGMLALT